MTKRVYPSDLLAQIRSILVGLGEIEPPPTFGPLDPAALEAELEQIRAMDEQIERHKTQLGTLQSEREVLCLSAWDMVKRLRFGVKALYGDDSIQYQHVGGKRLSDRKPWTRRS